MFFSSGSPGVKGNKGELGFPGTPGAAGPPVRTFSFPRSQYHPWSRIGLFCSVSSLNYTEDEIQNSFFFFYRVLLDLRVLQDSLEKKETREMSSQ